MACGSGSTAAAGQPVSFSSVVLTGTMGSRSVSCQTAALMPTIVAIGSSAAMVTPVTGSGGVPGQWLRRFDLLPGEVEHGLALSS
jgi:hypothetical protein